jgi:hypothetical protein
MTLPELLARMDALDVRPSLRLVIDAPSGALTSEMRGDFKTHKPMLFVRLAREAQWQTLREQRWGLALTDGGEPGIIIPSLVSNRGGEG